MASGILTIEKITKMHTGMPFIIDSGPLMADHRYIATLSSQSWMCDL